MSACDTENWKRSRRQVEAAAEATVRETHHRVTNHLQILASLVGLDARERAEPHVRDALMAVRTRILAIARIHAQLQQASHRETVELPPFMGRLAEDMRLCFGGETDGPVNLDFDIEAGEAPVETAVTLALIVNELVTNAVKHASIPKGGGIGVSLRHGEDGEWRLTVRDDGPGISVGDADLTQEHGLGLVQLLVRKLHGHMSIAPPGAGGQVSVVFY